MPVRLIHTVRGPRATPRTWTKATSCCTVKSWCMPMPAIKVRTSAPSARGRGLALAMRPGKRAALDKTSKLGQLIDQVERLKASVRAKVEHPFRVIKRQFGHVKFAIAGSRKTPRNSTPCLRWPICGWCAKSSSYWIDKSARKRRLRLENRAGKRPCRAITAEEFESIALRNTEFNAFTDRHYWRSIAQTFPSLATKGGPPGSAGEAVRV